MYYFQACTYPSTHPLKSYTDWLVAVTHPRSQHSQYKALVSVSMAPNHGCQGKRSIVQYDSKTLFTTKYHSKQLEPAKQNPDAYDCVWIDGQSQLKT